MTTEDESELLSFMDNVRLTPLPPANKPAPQEDSDDTLEAMLNTVASTPPPAQTVRPRVVEDDDGDDMESFLSNNGIKQEREVPDITKPWMVHHEFKLVSTVEEVERIVDEALKQGRCALDLETQGLDNRIEYDAKGNPKTVHQIVGFCLSVDGKTGYYVPVRHTVEDGGPNLNVPVEGVEAAIRRLCLASQPKGAPEDTVRDPLGFAKFTEPPKVILYFWNAQFDQEFLYPLTGLHWWHPDSYEDGMLACFCHYSADKGLSLKDKSYEKLRSTDGHRYEMIKLKELFIRGRSISFPSLSPDEPGLIKYACSDAICTYLLCEPPRKHEKERVDIMKLARTAYHTTYRIEKQTSQAVRGMERNRVKVHRGRIKELLEEHEKERDGILAKIQNFGASKGWHNLDPNSSKQLSDFLFGDGPNCLNITPKPEKNEKSGQYKTDADSLEGLVEGNPHAPPVLKWVVEYRGVEKVIGTYLLSMMNNPDKNDEMRFSFKQTGAGTGRFSAPANADKVDHGFGGIPIHGIPGGSSLRKTFIARDGYTMAKCDFAAQELRIAANVSGEKVWIKEFMEGDGDLHSITARAFFGKAQVTKDERKMGKTANFALIYGGGPAAIIRATGCDKMEASRRKSAFDKAVPDFAKWIKKQHAEVKKNLGVRTAFGRWLAIPDALHEEKAIQAACERYSTNYPIQGAGADIMKISMVTLHKEFYKRGWLRVNGGDDSVRMLLTVHDEIVFEIKHERVAEAIPLIVLLMESPTHRARPAWQVPLVVEPLVGPNWGSGYPCEKAKPGHKLKPNQMLVHGFVYGSVRVVDLGKDVPEASDNEVEDFKDEKGKKLGIRMLDPPWLRGVVQDSESSPGADALDHAEVAPSALQAAFEPIKGPASDASTATPVETPPVRSEPLIPPPMPAEPVRDSRPPPAGGPIGTVVIRINQLNRHTVEQVAEACFKAMSRNGKHLRLTDSVGTTIVRPALGVRIDPVKLAKFLSDLNLSDNKFAEEH